MSQNQLYRELAQITGETVDFIRHRGFSVIIVPRRRFGPRGGGGAQAQLKQPKPVESDTPHKAA
jgi:hypothetical protein